MTRGAALLGPLLALSLTVGPVGTAGAQAVEREVVVVRQGGLTEAAISACAGGAAIGVILVLASGTGAMGPTAGLFCGLSVAATVTASVAGYAWRVVGSTLP
jgi:hypothetical protein